VFYISNKLTNWGFVPCHGSVQGLKVKVPQALYASELDGDGWTTLRSGRFPFDTQCTECQAGLKAGLNFLGRRKFPPLMNKLNEYRLNLAWEICITHCMLSTDLLQKDTIFKTDAKFQ
jgi:hypothetical protein